MVGGPFLEQGLVHSGTPQAKKGDKTTLKEEQPQPACYVENKGSG